MDIIIYQINGMPRRFLSPTFIVSLLYDNRMTDNICNILTQRNRFLSLQKPLPRLTPLSPYPVFTQKQLNMRRKVEILQYKKNSTQTTQFTQSQKWSNLVNFALKTKNCVTDQYLPTLSTACDVPGPPIILQYDPTVPLYNYAISQDDYSSYIPTETEEMSVHFSDLLLAFNNIETLFFSLIIENIKKQINTFSMNIPLSIYISGNNNSISDISGNIILSKIILTIYYIGDTNTTPYLTKIITPSSTLSISTNTGLFNLTKYIGNFSFNNIVLPTKYGFVYDYKLQFTLTVSPSLQNFQYGVFMNIPDNSNNAMNCYSTPVSPTYIPFTFTGN